MANWRAILCVPVWLGLLVGPVTAQGTLTGIGFAGESAGTARRLAAVDALAAEGKLAKAVGEYVRILDEAGDDLVPLDARHAVAARRLCHARLAALPAEGLKLYRDRVDAQAKKWWEQAAPTHDERLLRRIVQEAFCSRYGDRALDLLGDLAFERGDFEEAEGWWRSIIWPAGEAVTTPPADGAKPSHLVFPDPRVDVARVRAKQMLARLFKGGENVDAQLRAYRAKHKDAVGELAGRKRKYADILEELSRPPNRPTNPVEHPPWTTFAGDPSRQWLIPRAPGPYLAELPPVRLENAGKDNIFPAPSAAARALAYYPVIAGGQVWLAEAARVLAYSLTTGECTGVYDLAEDLKGQGKALGRGEPTAAGTRFTLTAAGDKVFARLGDTAVGKAGAAGGPAGRSYLVCLDVRPGNRGKLARRWLVRAGDEKDDPAALFEGAPVARDGRVYVARARVAGAQVASAVECYSAATGHRHWRREVSEIRERSDGEPHQAHHLLTLAGPNLVYATHSGAVIALDAVTGRRAWAVRYPSRGLKTAWGAPSPRDLAPAVAHGGRVYVAPADYDRVFCLYAATGRTVWESQPVEVVHLLGVARGKLVLTTGRSSPGIAEAPEPQGIRALDATTGRSLRSWMQPADGSSLPSLGRGLLAGGKVLWPTAEGLRVLDQETGEADADNGYYRQRFRGLYGNMAFGDGCLAVAGTQELHVFVPAARRLGQLRRDAADQRQSARAQFLLALAELDAGSTAQAVDEFDRAERLSGPRDSWGGMALREAVRRHRHDALLALAENFRKERRWEEAARALGHAGAEEFSVGERARAIIMQIRLWAEAGQPTRAVAAWRQLCANDRLRFAIIPGEGEAPVSAGDYALQEMERLRQRFTNVNVPFEQGRVARPPDGRGSRELVARPLPNLSVPLHQLWHVETDPGEWMLGSVAGTGGQGWPDFFLSARGEELICRDAATGKARWTRRLLGTPSWAGQFADCLVAAGTDFIQGMSLTSGAPRWGFVPPAEWTNPDAAGASLSDFRLAGPRLFFLQDESRLWALDAGNGRALWTSEAPAARLGLRPPAGRFNPHYHVGRSWVAVQSTGGSYRVLDSRTGNPLFETERPGPPWSRPPLELDGQRLCLTQGETEVVMLEPAARKIVWTRTTANPSVTRQPPQIIGDAANLFLLVDGWQLGRIDPDSGKPVWETMAGTGPVDLTRATWDGRTICYVTGQTARARRLEDGRPLWQVPLPPLTAAWRVERTRHHLWVYPDGAPVHASWSPAFAVPPGTLPFFGVYALVIPFHLRYLESPVIILNPTDGKVVHEARLPVNGSPGEVRFTATGAVVAGGGRAWGFGAGR